MAELKDLIDEFAVLHNKIKPLQIRYDELKKIISKEANEIESLESIQLSSELNTIVYSAPTMTNLCTLTIKEFIAETNSYDSLTISTTAAKSNLPKEQFEKLFVKTPSKSRKLLEVLAIPNELI